MKNIIDREKKTNVLFIITSKVIKQYATSISRRIKSKTTHSFESSQLKRGVVYSSKELKPVIELQ